MMSIKLAFAIAAAFLVVATSVVLTFNPKERHFITRMVECETVEIKSFAEIIADKKHACYKIKELTKVFRIYYDIEIKKQLRLLDICLCNMLNRHQYWHDLFNNDTQHLYEATMKVIGPVKTDEEEWLHRFDTTISTKDLYIKEQAAVGPDASFPFFTRRYNNEQSKALFTRTCNYVRKEVEPIYIFIMRSQMLSDNRWLLAFLCNDDKEFFKMIVVFKTCEALRY